jgi:hypothetical protein
LHVVRWGGHSRMSNPLVSVTVHGYQPVLTNTTCLSLLPVERVPASFQSVAPLELSQGVELIGIDPTSPGWQPPASDSGYNLLHAAAKAGDMNRTLAALSSTDVNSVDSGTGNTALHWAAVADYPFIVSSPRPCMCKSCPALNLTACAWGGWVGAEAARGGGRPLRAEPRGHDRT